MSCCFILPALCGDACFQCKIQQFTRKIGLRNDTLLVHYTIITILLVSVCYIIIKQRLTRYRAYVRVIAWRMASGAGPVIIVMRLVACWTRSYQSQERDWGGDRLYSTFLTVIQSKAPAPPQSTGVNSTCARGTSRIHAAWNKALYCSNRTDTETDIFSRYTFHVIKHVIH